MPRFEPNPDRRPVLIAGASSGIGAATAESLAQQGYPVALGARRVDECEQLAEKIRAAGGEAIAHRLDVTDDDSVDAFVTAAEAALGPTEVVVSGAGDVEFALVHEMSTADFARQVDVHLVGPHRLARRLVPDMITRGRGDFVLISSDCAHAPRPRMGAYNAAKAGLEGMAEQMRMELEGTGVRVSLVRPGPTRTGMGVNAEAEVVGPLIEDWVAWGFARHPYLLRPSDMAAAISSVVNTPRGSQLILVEVQPEAPRKTESSSSAG